MPQGGSSSRSNYAYDIFGRLTSRHHPDAVGATLYKYDDLGRVRFSQNARQRASFAGNVIEKNLDRVRDAFVHVTRVGEEYTVLLATGLDQPGFYVTAF